MGVPTISDGGTRATANPITNAAQQDAHEQEYILALQHKDFVEAARVRSKYSFGNSEILTMNRGVFNFFLTNKDYKTAAQVANFDRAEMEPEYQEAFEAWYEDKLLKLVDVDRNHFTGVFFFDPTEPYRDGSCEPGFGFGVHGRLNDLNFTMACSNAFTEVLFKRGVQLGEKIAAHCSWNMREPFHQSACRSAYKKWMTEGNLTEGAEIATHCGLKMSDPFPQSVCGTAYKEWMSAGNLIKGAEIATSCGWNTDTEKAMIEGFIDIIDPTAGYAIAEKYGLYQKAQVLQERKNDWSAYTSKLSDIVEKKLTFNAAKKALSSVAAARHLSEEERKYAAKLFLNSYNGPEGKLSVDEILFRWVTIVTIAKLHGLDEKAQKIFNDVFWGFFNDGKLEDASTFEYAITTGRLNVKSDTQVKNATTFADLIVDGRFDMALARARADHFDESFISNLIRNYYWEMMRNGRYQIVVNIWKSGSLPPWRMDDDKRTWCSAAHAAFDVALSGLDMTRTPECAEVDDRTAYQIACEGLARREREKKLEIGTQERLREQKKETERVAQEQKKAAEKLVREQKKEAARRKQEEAKAQAANDRQERINAETKRKDNFVQSLVDTHYDAADRYIREGRWSNEVLRSLIDKALERFVSFPADCDKAKIVHKHYNWVGGLCEVKTTGKFVRSCKLECD